MATPQGAYNLSTKNRWILDIPFYKLEDGVNNDTFSLNIVSVFTPEHSIGVLEYDIWGYPFPVPTNVRSDTKQVYFQYLLDSNWSQYILLQKWMDIVDRNSGVEMVEEFSGDYTMDIELTVLTEFKNPVLHVTFKDAWISNIGAIDNSYRDDNGEPILHDFTVQYAKLETTDLTE